MHLTDVSDSQAVPSQPVRPDLKLPVWLTCPMPAPCTVIDADPEPARFPRRITLNPAPSTDHPCVTLPPLSPAVITTRRVDPAPCPTRHLTDVSDSQSVPSHPVFPTRALTVCLTTPRLDPCTVIELDPVPARFCRRITLTPPTSSDHPCVTLPPRPPAVITTRRLPLAPYPARHLTDVSDSHPVASHPVFPTRPRAVYATSPMLDPCTVIDAAPVPALFCRRVALTPPPMSDDHACVTLPPRVSTVITTRLVPRPPRDTEHLTDVSDSHPVASHPVCPSRALPVYETSPMLAPCTVTDAEPDPTVFPDLAALKPPRSVDHASVMLPVRIPTVIMTRRVPRSPCPTRHLTDVSDSHPVASHPVCP